MLLALINLKREIENLFILPFILIGKLYCILFEKKKKEYEVYFFFPFFHTGGAEDLHAKIANAIKNKSIIYFTRKSLNNRYLDEFKKSGHTIIDISRFTDNKLCYWNNLIFRGIISHKINSQKNKPKIFNGQSNFGYKISPWIRKDIFQIDLIHALSSFSQIRIPYIKFYKKTITVSKEIIDLQKQYYKKIGITECNIGTFEFIHPGIKDQKFVEKDYEQKNLNVLFVGRSSSEKRINLFGAIAEKTNSIETNIHFIMAGDVKHDLNAKYHSCCNLLGNINDHQKLVELYNKSHILAMTSTSESGPLVTMEAMQMGLSIVTTDTGFVANYITNGENGYKISAKASEEEIISFMSEKILLYYKNRDHLKKSGYINRDIAKKYFGLSDFNQKYIELFQNI
jgi:glycosyltransferase involved in cell wall biosynthesis